MEKYAFFNSHNHDRKYNADDLCNYIADLYDTGILINKSNALQVVANNDMTVTLKSGVAYINGHRYENTDDLILTLDNADGVLNRKDIIVVRYDKVARNVKAKIVKGTPASVATTPRILRNIDFWDLQLVYINMPKGSTKVTQSMITDTRLDNSVCGLMKNPLEHLDTRTLYLQIQADLEEFKNVEETDFVEWFSKIKINYEEFAKNANDYINKLISKADAQQLKIDSGIKIVEDITADLEHKRDTGAFKGDKGDNGVCVPTNGYYTFYVDENQHLICEFPDDTNPPNIMIDRDLNSPTYGHLVLNIGGAENA